ncbi:PI-actitoxin-Avd5a [Anabarilius grahami]|uniref:PI-actitoxin-Avd5a n=1 Tax=Anabarilius grahami TaxID=495550 RepID=A0A3N0ZAY5_ANAGA|nr:PI-actitoxin-Avd5a [Anabarilius grahami]
MINLNPCFSFLTQTVAVSDGARATKPQPEPIMCPMNYAPVCGSDGITYSNACELNVANMESGTEIFIVKKGRCDEDLLE